MTKQRIALISLVSLLVFGLLLGGQIMYKKKWINEVLMNQSQEIPGVISAKVVTIDGRQELQIETNHITNLRQASQKLEKLAGKKPIRFKDQRNSDLEALFNQMQFAIQEGIVRGNFTEMAQTVRKQAEQAGVKLELTMDSEAIYLTLNQNDAQLVAVLERHGQGRFLPSEGK